MKSLYAITQRNNASFFLSKIDFRYRHSKVRKKYINPREDGEKRNLDVR